MSDLAAATAVQDSRFIKKHLRFGLTQVQSFSRHLERVVVVCVSGRELLGRLVPDLEVINSTLMVLNS